MRQVESARWARVGDRLDEIFVATGKVAGFQITAMRDGAMMLQDERGFADIARERPFRDDTIVRVMSNTKPVTATAAMILLEEGRFRLDDPLSEYLPRFANQRVWVSGRGDEMITEPPRRPTTVRDVLRHTAGFTYGRALQAVPPGEVIHPVDAEYKRLQVDLARDVPMNTFVERIAQTPLRYHPGEGWVYSMASDVAGALVEAISGCRFEDFLEERVLAPLGMVDTGFHVPDDKLDRFAPSYSRGPDGRLVTSDDPHTSSYRTKPEFCSGGGGLVSTTRDYLRFCEMIRREGELDGTRILSPRAVRLMRANHLPGGSDIATMSDGLFVERGNAGVGYGLGFATTVDPVKAGTLADNDVYWGGLHSTLFWIDPIADLTVVFMVQLFPARTYDFRGPLRSLVYSALDA